MVVLLRLEVRESLEEVHGNELLHFRTETVNKLHGEHHNTATLLRPLLLEVVGEEVHQGLLNALNLDSLGLAGTSGLEAVVAVIVVAIREFLLSLVRVGLLQVGVGVL